MTAPGDAEELDDSADSGTLNDEEAAELTEAEDVVHAVSYSGTDFDVEGLVRRLDRGDIVIPTFGEDAADDIETARFQRSFVWRRPQMDRFIESLLLGFPIPGIMLVQQADKRYLVLDGQQRLRTLSAFYNGIHDGKAFSLSNVATEYKNLTYKGLSPEQKRTLDNTFIQATIVKPDNGEDSLDAVYQVFERLNSGGTQLTPHEIRIALYAGKFVDYLAVLNDDPSWRALYGRQSPRLRDQELVLRILALYVTAPTYKRPLKKFLNDFMYRSRGMSPVNSPVVGELFKTAAKLLLEGPGRGALRRGSGQINSAQCEALFVGLMRRLELPPEPSPESVAEAVGRTVIDTAFVGAVERATADEEQVRTRLAVATRAFADL